MTNPIGVQSDAEQRAHIERLLAVYPAVDHEETAVLIRWFRKKASALDVGLIASDPVLGKPYSQFKTDHLDRLSGADLVRAFVFVSILGAGLLSLIWFGM
jgi:hypothetical protein